MPAIFWRIIFTLARYEHLPIYKEALDLTVYFEEIVRNFSRYHKYTLGTELREKSREIIRCIIKAKSTRDRLDLRQAGSSLQLEPNSLIYPLV
ncbi:MAG: hypothetical protein E3K29_04110 [Candidatus Brocadia sp.]|nr:hypothetical protein [Candidatus Brocadia sp.]